MLLFTNILNDSFGLILILMISGNVVGQIGLDLYQIIISLSIILRIIFSI